MSPALNILVIAVPAASIIAIVVAWWYFGSRSSRAAGDWQSKIDEAEKLRSQLQKTIEAERREA
ncbi:MAG: hypothetical protein KKI08_17060, partial [Armatimonadetes bacterium]|nr:hypothetical protein [Armatimonadota bacterium]